MSSKASVAATLARLPRDANGKIIAPEYEFQPRTLGPTWAKDSAGGYILPEYTLGWQVIAWAEENLRDEFDNPWRFTLEQRRFVLWFYEVNSAGGFAWRAAILQRLKGWGKDPLAAVLAAVELVGPCRFGGWADRPRPDLGLVDGSPAVLPGDPIAVENPAAWVQVAAVSQEQTQNTMLCFHWVFSEELRRRYKIVVSGLQVLALGGRRKIKALTKSPKALEGNRPSFVILNETHHWVDENQGTKMFEAIGRNATKSKGGAARRLSITNAFDPSENSVAQKQRKAWEDEEAGLAVKTGVLYDSLEAFPDTRLTPWRDRPKRPDDMSEEEYEQTLEAMVTAWLSALVRSIRGDAIWLDIETIVKDMLSGETSASLKKRFWLNVSQTPEDAWVHPTALELAVHPKAAEYQRAPEVGSWLEAAWAIVEPTDEVVVFGDGSKSEDSTALVGCRISDGYCFLIGVWQKPPGKAGDGWRAPREAVDQRVREAFQRFNVVGFWFDPSHTIDDEDSSRYWDGWCDTWMQRYSTKLKQELWAVKSGHRTHAVMFDMTSPERSALFVASAEKTREEFHAKNDIEEYEPQVLYCGSPALTRHLQNARLYATKWGWSVGKESRESQDKVDAAVCLVGARMMRRIYTNATVDKEPPRSGRVWGY